MGPLHQLHRDDVCFSWLLWRRKREDHCWWTPVPFPHLSLELYFMTVAKTSFLGASGAAKPLPLQEHGEVYLLELMGEICLSLLHLTVPVGRELLSV